MNSTQIKATLRLFKSYINDQDLPAYSNTNSLSKGILYDKSTPSDVMLLAEELYGIDVYKWNATFHKSLSTVRDESFETLLVEQLLHYITTYGFESLGIYDKDTVYIPKEQLDIPELESDITLTIIHQITVDQLKEKLMTLVTSGIALSTETISDIMILSDYLDKTKFDQIKNKEIKTALYEKYNIVPSNNMDFLRYLIYKTTESTLLIKNDALKKKIKQLDNTKLITAYNYIKSYISEENGLVKLSEIYWRYKDLFVAYKRKNPENAMQKELNHIINRLDKLSHKYYKPIGVSILDTLTSMSFSDIYRNKDSIEKALDKATTFRLIRIYNGLKYRSTVIQSNDNAIMYRIRNGKSFATTFNKVKDAAALNTILSIVKDKLIDRLNNKLAGKSFYIPNNITYMAPSSEKQFIDNIPEGSYIEIPRTDNMLVGVHWNNLPDDRVDLDLHMQDKGEQFGWNTAWRSQDRNFMFSGDITDAQLPNGATEVFFIGRNSTSRAFLLTLNEFTRNDEEVPFEIVVATTKDTEVDKNYIINPNNILLQLHKKFDAKCNMLNLGLVKILPECIRFYFSSSELGTSIVTRQNNVTEYAREYINKYSELQLTINEVLGSLSNITVSNTPNIETMEEVKVKNDTDIEGTLYRKVSKPVDYNLSLEAIDKTTLIDIFGGI